MSCISPHIQDTVGSCLSATISRIGDGIRVSVQSITEPIGVLLSDAVEKHLRVRCSIVCSLSEITDYLNVTPKDIQWITDDMGVFFDVESNVDWIIVTS